MNTAPKIDMLDSTWRRVMQKVVENGDPGSH